MNILSASQIREADHYTIDHEPIASIDLMERASNAFVEKFLELIKKQKPIHIFCGIGNNGGDGLAIGRMLSGKGWKVSCYVVGDKEKGSEDFKTNLAKLSDYLELDSISDIPAIQSEDIIIDGFFGSGLTRPIEGKIAEFIEYLNNLPATRISIDISSGLFSDESLAKRFTAFKPHHTISFQCPKLVFFLPQYHEFVGEWHIVDIGLDASFLEKQLSNFHISDNSELSSLIPVRSKYVHKSNVGKLLVVAGSKGKMGAAALCAQAALRTGVGLINVCVPKCGTSVIQTLVPEAMVIEGKKDDYTTQIPDTRDTLAIGPGIGTAEETKNALVKFLQSNNQPVVLDADAINIIAESDLISFIPKNSILTPHPGEFKRLAGEWDNDFHRLELLRSICTKYELNMVLKGAYSAVCNTDGEIYFNPSGNPGMATAGSGDVLTGIIASLLAQGLSPFDALRLGVFLHGLAGDLAAKDKGQNSLIASDIILKISNVIQSMRV
jgi:NAD(P)H-hydrate epimerase